MKKFAVSSDSTCDLYASEIKDMNIHFVPLVYTMDIDDKLEEYTDNYTSYDQYVEYYNQLRKGGVSKTSMLNYAAHLEHFTAMAEAGVTDAIHFTISYALSPTVDVARKAVAEVQETYPNFNCLCVESHTTTIGQGMLVRIACDMRDKGKELQETFDYVETVKHKIQHFIIADSLMYLRRGGRVGSAKAIVGTMLNIKPVLTFTKEGKLEKYKQASGMKTAIKNVVDEYANYTVNKEYPLIYIVHTDNVPMAELLKKSLEEKYGVSPEIRIMGPIIGTHVGPNSLAYAFISNEERPI
jgi:DegV family protein with EDD domain